MQKRVKVVAKADADGNAVDHRFNAVLLQLLDRPRRLIVAWRALFLLVLSGAIGMTTMASLRTEFGVVQQLACRAALWHDDGMVIPEPKRLPIYNEEASFTQLRKANTRNEDTCSPRTLDASAITNIPARSQAFYTKLQALQRDGIATPPVFNGSHTALCDESRGRRSDWQYCLPITGRKDEPFCSRPDRMDVLQAHNRSRDDDNHRVCFASALHMLMVDVYEVLKATGGQPLVLFGTLLGAIRTGTTIPFTEDADIGYVCHPRFSLATVREVLWSLGYHLFHQGVWRVCVAPTHPLAGLLHDPTMITTTDCKVPYVDLYAMSPVGSDRYAWSIEKMLNNRLVPRHKFEPLSQVQLNDEYFDTVADPIDFLVHEYGDDYMTPVPRNETE